ncbi:MAG TPA: hypothetical protein VIF40_10805 [Methylosinus sp.]|uniref:hypothetical protein n=1 Tax=Methylosinus sp. TaxID=427 RepID=UPI002F931047
MIDVFDAGEPFGLMGRIALAYASNAPAVFVAPLNQIDLNRSHSHIRPLARSMKKLGGEGGDRSRHRRAGTIFASRKLPLRVCFEAMCHLTQCLGGEREGSVGRGAEGRFRMCRGAQVRNRRLDPPG